MIDSKKLYIGTVDNIELAASIYDILKIKSKGIFAKTNFNYTDREIKEIQKIKFEFIKNKQTNAMSDSQAK